MLVSAANSLTPVRAAAPQAANDAAGQKREPERAPASRPQRAEGSSDAPRAEVNLKTPSEYRLVYDDEFSRIFVQVVDRSSGEEILRFPPEELVRFIDDSIERANARVTSGLFLDRSI